MLRVAAVQLGDPVSLLVLVKPNDPPLHQLTSPTTKL
jgi:hypothetical protein